MRLLTRRLGTLSPEVVEQVQALSIDSIEALGEALLDFSQLTDLLSWLTQHQPT